MQAPAHRRAPPEEDDEAAAMANDLLSPRWKIEDAIEKYGIQHWGKGYFTVNDAGHMVATPNGPQNGHIDIK